MQTSIVVCGAYQSNAAFVSVRGNSAKVRNLRRDPRCTVLGVTSDWRSYAVIEGQASLKDAKNTDPEELRVLLREVFRACGDKDHPDWEEYDRAMVQQDAVVVFGEARASVRHATVMNGIDARVRLYPYGPALPTNGASP